MILNKSAVLALIAFLLRLSHTALAAGECETDNDCVPGQCCHPKSCVSVADRPKCDDIRCSFECHPGTTDCGGSCKCVRKNCQALLAGPNEQACISIGGDWQTRRGNNFCNYPTADSGRACASTEDCEGECMAENKNSTVGKCSAFQVVLGCVILLKDGKAEEICID